LILRLLALRAVQISLDRISRKFCETAVPLMLYHNKQGFLLMFFLKAFRSSATLLALKMLFCRTCTKLFKASRLRKLSSDQISALICLIGTSLTRTLVLTLV